MVNVIYCNCKIWHPKNTLSDAFNRTPFFMIYALVGFFVTRPNRIQQVTEEYNIK